MKNTRIDGNSISHYFKWNIWYYNFVLFVIFIIFFEIVDEAKGIGKLQTMPYYKNFETQIVVPLQKLASIALFPPKKKRTWGSSSLKFPIQLCSWLHLHTSLSNANGNEVWCLNERFRCIFPFFFFWIACNSEYAILSRAIVMTSACGVGGCSWFIP